MKTEEVKIGGEYLATVSGKLVTLRVNDIIPAKDKRQYDGHKRTTSYVCTNLATGREVNVKIAMRFRGPARAKATVGHKSQGKAWNEVIPTLNKKVLVTKDATIGAVVPEVLKAALAVYDSAKGGQHAAPSIDDNASTQYGKPTAKQVAEAISPIVGQSFTSTKALGEKIVSLADKLKGTIGGEATKPTFKPTEEQEAILEAVRANPKVLVLEAGAGAGKTSTLRLIADVLEGNGQYTAFNSSLVKDSSIKFQGTNVACNTTHSLGFKAEGRRFAHRLNGQRVRSDRVAVILGIREFSCMVDAISDKPANKRLAPGFLAGQITTAIKRFCQSADKEITTAHFKHVDGIDPPTGGSPNNEKLQAYLLPFARKAWQDISDEQGQLPFSHDCYVKIWQLSNPVITGDYILLDESQDTSGVMLDIIRQQTVPVIMVGDSSQQIYEWRGAINAMAAFPDAPRKYLTQSFRFGQAIADVANAVLATLQEATPLRIRGTPSIASTVEKVENPTCILCRTNAVAVSSLLAAIAAGKKPFLIGGTSELVSFVKAALDLQQGRPTHHPELACFDNWREVKEYSELDEGSDLQLMVKLIDAFGATVIIDALVNMPEEKDADITISTAHKSKGREWETVRLAADFPTKSKCCDADRKLLYVAATRAKQTLDISRCPFFTGQDSLDLLGADGKAKPVTPAMVAPTTFTWAKGKNETWLVRGPKGHEDKVVEIVTKSGKTSRRRLAEVITEDDASATYRPY